MAIDWQKLPDHGSGLPHTGEQVLLAVPHRVGEGYGGGLDPDLPYSLHLARWDDDEMRWATNEHDEDTGGIYWLPARAPLFWAEVDLPS